jgi:hypothetical protein
MNQTGGGKPEEPVDPGFAPEDYTDGRREGDWRSRYDEEARGCIRAESIYLAVALLAVSILMFLTWLGIPQRLMGLSDQQAAAFLRHTLAATSGILGGIIFAMKWLYHSVAKQLWHQDRKLWRYFTPIISGGVSFAMVLAVESFGVFDPSIVSTGARATAFGFLVGFFSDNALAKLAELAQTLFGPTHKPRDTRRKHE